MPRKKKTNEDDQLDLIDVAPENAKAIMKAANEYEEALGQRLEWLADEKKAKQKILELVHDAQLEPDENGRIRFRLNGKTITITPRDELVQVKDDSAEAE